MQDLYGNLGYSKLPDLDQNQVCFPMRLLFVIPVTIAARKIVERDAIIPMLGSASSESSSESLLLEAHRVLNLDATL